MSKVYVFVGPSLRIEAARAELPEAVYLPPVAQGDVYRVARRQPLAIGIIDGYFERQPAVWHKEILWSLSQGIPVYGSASMGALRAAELSVFGMHGVGDIFEAFQSGELEDDDEVAVAHASADEGYRALSEPMVNIRATLRAAEAAGALTPSSRLALERAAKALFYPERTYAAIVERAGLPQAELDSLAAWLPKGRVDQKQADAVRMLRLMREHLEAGRPPAAVDFRFEYTTFWDAAVQAAGVLDQEDEMVGLPAVFAELGLHGSTAAQARQTATLRQLALENAALRGYSVDEPKVERLATRFRAARGLEREVDFERWLGESHLTRERFAALMHQEALAALVVPAAEHAASARLVDQLRLTGEYRRLIDRAVTKQGWLAAEGLEHVRLEDVGLTAESLVRWHFARLGSPPPANLPRYARSVGFEDDRDLVSTLLREFCFVSAAA
jgi:hypothetical protein